jgi:hypothetical protein
MCFRFIGQLEFKGVEMQKMIALAAGMLVSGTVLTTAFVAAPGP